MTTIVSRSSVSATRTAPGSARLLRGVAALAAIGMITTSVLLVAAPSRAALPQGSPAPAASDSASSASASKTDRLSPLSELILRRIRLADPVAASKWLGGRPISDPGREQAVVDAAVARASQRDIDPALVRRVIRAQIEASKVVQRSLFVRWTHDPATAPTTSPDLTTIRQQLDAIDDALVDSVGTSADVADSSRCGHLVDAARAQAYPGLDSAHRKAIHVAWGDFCSAR